MNMGKTYVDMKLEMADDGKGDVGSVFMRLCTLDRKNDRAGRYYSPNSLVGRYGTQT